MLYSFEDQQTEILPRAASEGVSDEDLLSAIAGRDEKALETLLSRYRAMLHQIISRCVNNRADADDILQQCAVEIWKQAERYDRTKGAAAGWLITMARRRAIDWTRRRSSYENNRERYSAQPLPQIAESTAEDEASRHDTGEVFAKLLARLPAEQADAVRLAFYSGLSQRQIAAHTGIALGTIKTRLELGLNKLRVAVMSYGDWRAEFSLT